MKRRIYLDHVATTPLSGGVRVAMTEAMGKFGNPSSLHEEGRVAYKLVEYARMQVADLIGAKSGEIVFTSGGTEANNAVFGALPVANSSEQRRKVIVSAIEHPSVYRSAERLTERGYEVLSAPVDEAGKVKLDELEAMFDKSVVLVSVMLVNNEIGTIQDLGQIAKMARKYGVLVHTDAVQAIGKIAVNVRELGVDYLSMSAHKLGGPKGVGVLYVREGVPSTSLLVGGDQEERRRAGTENVLGIVGFGQACTEVDLAVVEGVRDLRDWLREEICRRISEVTINSPDDAVASILNVSFAGIEGETIMLALDAEGIAVSTGSACASRSISPSRVLMAISADDAERAHNSVRFSLGAENTMSEMVRVVEVLERIVVKYRDVSSLGAIYAG